MGINRTDNSLLHQDIRRLLDQLAAAGPFIACPWDSTLLGDLQVSLTVGCVHDLCVTVARQNSLSAISHGKFGPMWVSIYLDDLQGLAGTKWLLAANFKDNAEILPNFIKQVWLLAALLPSSSLFVSVYESGSEDATTGMER